MRVRALLPAALICVLVASAPIFIDLSAQQPAPSVTFQVEVN